MRLYPSGDIEVIAQTHAENMANAGICRTRHTAIVNRLRELEATQ